MTFDLDGGFKFISKKQTLFFKGENLSGTSMNVICDAIIVLFFFIYLDTCGAEESKSAGHGNDVTVVVCFHLRQEGLRHLVKKKTSHVHCPPAQ